MRPTPLVMVPCIAAFASVAMAQDLTGVPRIVDADTINLAGVKVRLEGIDAPEMDQVCVTTAGEPWECGVEAKNRLKAQIGMATVVCQPEGRDRYRRTLAVCRVGRIDLNAWMVREGWALSFARHGDRYRAEEDDAREHRRGLWAGAFIAPWDWRSRNEATEILGAAQVPIEAQRVLVPRR